MRQNGFDVSQIRIVVSVQPRVLLCRVDKTLKPNIDHFLKIGFSKPDFFEVVSVNPYVLFNCHPQFVRATEALKDVMELKNIWVFLCDSSRFLDGVHLMASFGEKNIESKIRMFENFGCMRSDVLALGRKNPMLLGLSEARIKRSLEYLMKELGFSPDYVMSHGALLSYSLEKRIIPRIRVLLALKEKGLIKKDHAPYTILNRSEPHFLNRYVLPFEEIREVYAKELAKLTDRSSMKPSNEGRAGDDKP
ncbi:transcription termination factor MTERF15, mitochondrial-like [Chenopodium quinoa]|uniref:transcription termination factor MTERF15, mitochondrial-like n=1 Tax=Chenopodium quinoa TaxID=63459 RepID=UPI000B7715C6|nr:transcription termination factor MTERF15, mitochondrial-like [Chenopodium quinoa]